MWCLAKDRGKLELRHLYFDRPCGKLLFRLVGMKPINFWRNFLNSAFKIIDRLFWLWINKLCFYKRLKTFEMTKWNILQVSKDGKWLLSQMPSRARARILDWDHSFVTCWQAFCCTLKKKGKRPRLKIAVKHSPTGRPVLQENFPGNIKLQLQPQKHQLRNGTLSNDYSGKNLFWVTTAPAWALLISYLVVQVITCRRKIWFPPGNA